MSRLPLVAVPIVALALAAPGLAAAKEVAGAKVCGASDCREVEDKEMLTVLPMGGDPTDPPKHPAGGWYRVDISIRGEEGASDTFSMAALPREGYLRGYDDIADRFTWMLMSEDARRGYNAVVRGLEPKPVASLRGLDQKPPEVRVDEVVMPPQPPAPEGGFAWGWLAGGLGVAAVAGAGVVTRRRRRSSASQPRPGPQAAG